jgi:5-methylcytosine-specific restriction endonuclease McrA
MGRQYSKEDCIESLSKAADSVEGKLTTRDYREMDTDVSIRVIWDRFGTWNNAKEQAELETNRSSDLDRQKSVPEILNTTPEEWEDLSKNVRFRRRNQAMVAKIKLESGCNRCGYDENPIALELHHLNPNDKFMDVSTMITQGYSVQRIKNEIEKCEILCANCHSIETSGNVYDV